MLFLARSTAIKPVKKRNDEKSKIRKREQIGVAKAQAQEKQQSQQQDTKSREALKRKLANVKGHWLVGNAAAEKATPVLQFSGDVELQKMISSKGGSVYEEVFMVEKLDSLSKLIEDKDGSDKPGCWIHKWHLSGFSSGRSASDERSIDRLSERRHDYLIDSSFRGPCVILISALDIFYRISLTCALHIAYIVNLMGLSSERMIERSTKKRHSSTSRWSSGILISALDSWIVLFKASLVLLAYPLIERSIARPSESGKLFHKSSMILSIE